VVANRPKNENTKRVQVVLPESAVSELSKIAKTKGFAGISALLRFIALEFLEKS